MHFFILEIKAMPTKISANPFEDGSDFENFDFVKYDFEISEEIFAKAKLDTPLNIFKFMVLKLSSIIVYIDKYQDPEFHQIMLKNIQEIKTKYMEFKTKEVSMSAREHKYVKSVTAILELAEMAQTSLEKAEKYRKVASENPGQILTLEDEAVNVQKLKQICNDISTLR